MPITAWICQGCGRREVPLDHFATTECGEKICHPDYAAAVLADRAGQRVGAVRVSHGLGCPRRAGIEQTEDYAVDPLDLLPAMSGVGWHAIMEKAAAGQAEIPVALEVDGVRVVGKADRPRMTAGELVIEDWKTKGDYQFSKKVEPDVEHVIQLSMYGHALGASRLGVWYKSHSEFKPMYRPRMEMAAMLEHRPHDGEFTVRELYHQADAIFNKGARWQDAPLAGQSQKFGRKTACDYCSVRETCTVAAFANPWG